MSEELTTVPLSSAIASLREEIQQAAIAASRLPEKERYKILEVEIELSIAVGKRYGAEGKVGWWVVEATADASMSQESLHVVKLKLDIGEQDVSSLQTTN